MERRGGRRGGGGEKAAKERAEKHEGAGKKEARKMMDFAEHTNSLLNYYSISWLFFQGGC